MPRQSPVGEIWRPVDQVEDVSVAQPGPGNLWVWASNGSWRVHSNFVIRIPPKINTNFVTTFTTPEGEFPKTVFLSINRRTCLVSMRDKIFAQPRTNDCKLFQTYICRR